MYVEGPDVEVLYAFKDLYVTKVLYTHTSLVYHMYCLQNISSI